MDILLSTDGGQTFPTVLAAATPNDGTQAVTIPNTGTTTARIKVQSVGNIFFDISNANFTITVAPPVTVSGRIFAAGGRGIKSGVVTLTDQQSGAVRTMLTGVYGTYTFVNVEAGRTYVLSAVSRRYSYTLQTLQINSGLSNLDFTPNP